MAAKFVRNELYDSGWIQRLQYLFGLSKDHPTLPKRGRPAVTVIGKAVVTTEALQEWTNLPIVHVTNVREEMVFDLVLQPGAKYASNKAGPEVSGRCREE